MEQETYTITTEADTTQQRVTETQHTDSLSELVLRLTLETLRSPLEEMAINEQFDDLLDYIPVRDDVFPSYTLDTPSYAWKYEDVPAVYSTDQNSYEHARDGEERAERATQQLHEMVKHDPSVAGRELLVVPMSVREDGWFLKLTDPLKFQLLYDSQALALVGGTYEKSLFPLF